MAEGTTVKTDFSSALAGLDSLKGSLRTKLARSMAVAGGKVLRDGAIEEAPVGTAEGGSITPGLLKSSIYLAYKQDRSNAKLATYSISWNSRKAPHGHLIEFGHWMYFKVYKGADGEWYTNLKAPLEHPRWVPAQPFLRPALDTYHVPAEAAMLERGRVRLAELLAGKNLSAEE